MALLKLDVLSVRNIRSASIQPSPFLNLITGANASGKSSLLEAIFILGRTRSFRTTHIKQTIEFDQPCLVVSARNGLENEAVSHIGIRIDGKQTEIRIDQESRHKADLAYALPVQLIHPKSYRLLDGGPQLRREFLDWGIFNQHRGFLANWRKFGKALQQRNALLKARQYKQLSAWDKELAEYGRLVNDFRLDYIQVLQPAFEEMTNRFLNATGVNLTFSRGWDNKLNLEQALKADLEKDMRYGFTHSGPHRADFLCYSHNRLAKDYLSRGQQKLLVLALLLSQVNLLNQIAPNSCCILIDDLTAELDTANRLKLLEYLTQSGCQVFMTATELNDFGNLEVLKNYKVFHVEQGCIKQL
ncbi:MAG: DNA replication/repair protein RecF [Methylococcales bacterium]|nr:DNA replication/repair protein RecF [Methylococcales bacterium]